MAIPDWISNPLRPLMSIWVALRSQSLEPAHCGKYKQLAPYLGHPSPRYSAETCDDTAILQNRRYLLTDTAQADGLKP